MNFGNLLSSTRKSIVDFSIKNGHIITGVGACVGVVVTAVLAYKTRPKIDAIMEEQKEKMDEVNELRDNPDVPEEEIKKAEKEVTMETIKRVVPAVAPVVFAGIATIGINTWSIVIGEKKITNLTAAAAISEAAYKELYDKTKDIVGEEKAQEIQQEIAQDRVTKLFGDDGELVESIALQGIGGDQLFYDYMTGRIFKSDVHAIIRACETLNHKITSGKEAYLEYNEFFIEMDLNPVGAGDGYGWGGCSLVNILEPNLNNTVRVGDRALIVLDWYTRPTQNFR